jgi:hypothetical protein
MMSTRLTTFERLARSAREDGPPPIDVAPAVLARLRADAAPSLERGLWLAPALGWAVAMVLAWWAWPAWQAMLDPLASWFRPLTVVLQ